MKDLFAYQVLSIPVAFYVQAAAIVLLAGLLRKYIASWLTTLFFTVFRQIANEQHKHEFNTKLQKPLEGLVLTICFFIALNRFVAWWELITIFQRHKMWSNGKTAATEAFTLMELIDRIFFLAFIFYAVFLLVRVSSFLFFVWVQKATVAGDRERRQLLPLLRDVLAVLLWSFGFFTVLGVVFHVNVPTLIAGLGFGGVAVAFAAKESLENLLASLMIMVDKPFAIGDHIKIGNAEGRVEQIGFRSTRLRTFDKTLVSLPNKTLIGDSLENFSERGTARVKFSISAGYGIAQQNLKSAIAEIKSAIESHTETVEDAHVFLERFGATIEINVSYFVRVPSEIPLDRVKEDINFEIYRIMYRHAKGFGAPSSITLAADQTNDVEI